MKVRRLCAAAICSVMSCPALSAPVEIEIDPSTSELDVILFVLGVGDSDSTPLAGTVVIDLEGAPPQAQLSIIDFHLHATEPVQHTMTFGLPGELTQTTEGLEVNAAEPGTPSVPAGFDGAMFDISHLDTELAGMGSYEASGFVCTALQGEGIGCDGIMNLASLGEQVLQDIDGVLAVEGDAVSLSISFEVEVPYEGLGTLVLSGFATGVGTLPPEVCAGDCDRSGGVDFNDLVAILFEFGPAHDDVCDADASGSIDFNDLVAALFLFGPCP